MNRSSSSVYQRIEERHGSDHDPRITLARGSVPQLSALDPATRYAPLSDPAADGDDAADRQQVWDVDLRRPLSMRILRADAGAQPEEEFLAQAQLAAGLDHPAIPPIHDFGVDLQSRPFWTMPVERGASFVDVIEGRQASTAPSVDHALEILTRVAEAIAFAHDRRVVHGQITAAAIRVGAFGDVRVGDWDRATRVDEGAALDPSPDLGALAELLNQILALAAPKPPRELLAIRDRAADRAAGYTDVDAFIADLQAFRDGRVVTAHATGAFAELRKWIRRNRALAVAAAVVIVTLVGLATTAMVMLRQEQAAAQQASTSAQTGFAAIQSILTHLDDRRFDGVAEVEPIRRAIAASAERLIQDLDRRGSEDLASDVIRAVHRLQSSLDATTPKTR